MCHVHIMMLLANPPLCITLVCQPPPHPPLWVVTFWHLIQRCSSAFLPRCVFAPWLHRYSFISLGMVSRHNSFCAFCTVISQEAKKSLQWKLHLCLSPLQPLRAVLKWGQMTHEPLCWTSALTLFSAFTRMLWNREKTTETAARSLEWDWEILRSAVRKRNNPVQTKSLEWRTPRSTRWF